MNEQNNKTFGQKLLEQNGCCDPQSPLMKGLISEEKQKLRLIRNICIGVWVGFMFILMAMAFLMLLRSMTVISHGADPGIAMLHPLAMLSTLALVGLMVAVAVTLVFYFRSRTVNLGGIEQRLAVLERMLASQQKSPGDSPERGGSSV